MTTGRYQLGYVVGVGSFATVYHATDPLLDDTVVVKMLAENHSLNPEIRERFITEGRSLRKVASEHVVTVHDIGESDYQQPYLVLEFADRGTLADRVHHLRAQGWQPSPEDLLSMARPLAQALEAIHTAKLVHRDLSPGNLLLATEPAADATPSTTRLVTQHERLLLSDLGMCKDLAINSGLTVSGGTAGFRPPEQSQPGLVDTRADIWAASALLAWVAEGAELPETFHEVIRRGMAPDPAQRQQTIAEWLSDLETVLVPQPPPPPVQQQASAETAQPSPHQPVGKKPRRRFSALVSAGVAVIMGVLGLLAGVALTDDGYPSSVGDASIAISGPSEVSVGETATYVAETEGVHSWVWSLPTGTSLVDDHETSMTATEPGTTEIVLRARTSNGDELEARYRVQVRD
jgi:serine/threonine protein kinase